MENEKGKGEGPKKVKVLSTSSLQITQNDAFHLVGSIVEKGISDSQNNPIIPFHTFPKPTVLPFPVARHRSHGPHWRPLSSKGNDDDRDDDSDNNLEDEEDKTLTEFEKVAAFAKPVQRRRKKGLDFRKWKEITQDDNSSLGKKSEEDVSSLSQTTGKRKNEKGGKNADKKTSASEDNVIVFMKEDVKPKLDNSDHGFIDLATTMELDTSNKVDTQEKVKYARIYDDKEENESVPELDQICSDRMPDYNFGSLDVQEKEKTYSTSSMLPSSVSNNIRSEKESMSLESEIDAENRARIKQMSTEEIVEARAEIMEKISPGLLKVLQKRGQEKLKKHSSFKSEVGTGSVSVNQHIHSAQDAKSLHTENDNSHTVMTPPSKQKLGDEKISSKTSTTTNSSQWNAWSSRVEAVRELRFSLAGDVVDSSLVPVYDNVAERDYLRTEGDPGAAGYTIKEAVALTRSVIPGQRALALQLLSSVLDKALHYICKDKTGHISKSENKVDKSVDWEAVWAFALGPEPELALSLRICLDDNHNSVILACAKVVQCVLSCEVNDNYFEISEKIATYDKDIFTAPVFRSRPDMNAGFLQGGFWKYSAKPSNILPFSEDSMDNETEGKHTIQDDVVVAGQDFTVGLVRMGILPRLHYLLETDPTTALEECIISILIAIARHSPTCANAILKCERLIQIIVNRFTIDNLEIRFSMIKSVRLLKVLARLDPKTCLEFIKNGYFQAMTWNLYQYPSSIDHWLKLGKEKCKLGSALRVEQLRFWRVCIQYGYCVSYFSEMFPALCFWLNPPSFEKLVGNNVLYECASISREAYLVLESLAGRIPDLFSQQCLNKQLPESTDDTEVWSWSYVGPMFDLAIKWIATRSDPEVCKLFEGQEEGRCDTFRDLSVTSLLWVYVAVTHVLFRVLERMTCGDTISPQETEGHVPWLPEFVPKIGLELIKYWLLGESFMKELTYLRQKGDIEMSLASTCCLNGMVKLITTIDNLIQSAKSGICSLACEKQNLSREGKVLEDGIVNGCLVELRSMLNFFIFSVSSGWHHIQSIESFGRGGPAPGAGIGWGAPGGGLWSKTVLLVQTDARFLVYLLEIFENASKDVPITEETTFAMQRINTALGLCLTAGPRDKVVIEKALEILFHVSVFKYLELCIQNFLLNRRGKTFRWQYEQEDYLHFSKMLSSHFRSRWLSVKLKVKAVDGNSSSGIKTSPKVDARLDTIYEDSDMSSITSSCNASLMTEWAHQKLPLPVYFYLGPISTILHTKRAATKKVDSTHNIHDPTNLLEVAKCGLFFILGVEAMFNFQGSDIFSPIQQVSLTWKLHSLSVNFLVGMEMLEQDQGRDTFEALQDLYGELLDKARFDQSKAVISDDKKDLEFLRFQQEIHESYSIFIEDLVEQFSAISYGDVIFGRQVSLYLHRCVESSIRLAAWNTLSNARVLQLLPPLEKCISGAEGYLEPTEDNEEILEAYTKSWVSDALDRAAIRGSVAYALVVHHLSSFIFHACPMDNLLLRNRLARSLLRDYSRKQQHEGMLLDLIHHNKPPTSDMGEQMNGLVHEKSWLESRFEVLVKSCEGNSSLLRVVKKLKAIAEKSSQ
ncbi:transcriptional elongation regulator MINIYO [Abrus precatorius]|uniref:Transcriptional elongation regulator MINIYO n=1 Tax=Abrus precatorius TaxID=3816 RepID=A0A8B8LTS6_ABRPR|nr:transcriptional elongation regulator MINIYO [Abrus precatorius]XP_027359786.1 transcriptional elongation regulator MINIYO [Abrus precatorius]